MQAEFHRILLDKIAPLFFTFAKYFELTNRLDKTTYCGVLFMRPLDVVPLTQSSTSDLTLREFGKRVKISHDYATDTGSIS